jgi:hypothetical protein
MNIKKKLDDFNRKIKRNERKRLDIKSTKINDTTKDYLLRNIEPKKKRYELEKFILKNIHTIDLGSLNYIDTCLGQLIPLVKSEKKLAIDDKMKNTLQNLLNKIYELKLYYEQKKTENIISKKDTIGRMIGKISELKLFNISNYNTFKKNK